MKTPRHHLRAMIAALMLLVIAACIVLVVHAQGPNTIQGCYSNGNGSMRRVNSSSDCNNSETPISWNIVGPVGPQGVPGVMGPVGAQGVQGQQGPIGEKGEPGPQGSTGPQGLQGIPGVGALRVLDSLGNEVGTYNDEGLVIRRNETMDMWLRFSVDKNGFIDGNIASQLVLIYTTSNCSGTAYLQSEPDALVQKAVVYGQTVYQPSNTHQTMNFQSYRYGFGPNQPCEPSGGVTTASQPVTYPVSNLGLTPPFRLVR